MGPVLLCTEGPLDFLKDVLAIAFISKLDDTDYDDNEEGIVFMIKHIRSRLQLVESGINNGDDTIVCNDRTGHYLQRFHEQVSTDCRSKLAKLVKVDNYTDEWQEFLDDTLTPEEAALMWLSTIEQCSTYGWCAFGKDCLKCASRLVRALWTFCMDRLRALWNCISTLCHTVWTNCMSFVRGAREPDANMLDPGYAILP